MFQDEQRTLLYYKDNKAKESVSQNIIQIVKRVRMYRRLYLVFRFHAFHQETGHTIKLEASEMLHLEHS